MVTVVKITFRNLPVISSYPLYLPRLFKHILRPNDRRAHGGPGHVKSHHCLTTFTIVLCPRLSSGTRQKYVTGSVQIHRSNETLFIKCTISLSVEPYASMFPISSSQTGLLTLGFLTLLVCFLCSCFLPSYVRFHSYVLICRNTTSFSWQIQI